MLYKNEKQESVKVNITKKNSKTHHHLEKKSLSVYYHNCEF